MNEIIICDPNLDNKYDAVTEDGDNKSLALFNNMKIKGRLIILFLNPSSGSQEGQIILDIIAKHRIESSPSINLVKFPIDSHLSFIEIEEQIDEHIISIDHDQYSTVFNKNKHFSVAAFNILDKADYDTGIQFILSHLASSNSYKKLHILIGAGDGTVLRIVEELNQSNVDLSRCVFGHIPLGTGNDLSNSMGFGNSVSLDSNINTLHRILYTYVIAIPCKIDIWKIAIRVNEENGLINAIKKDQERSMFEEKGTTFIKQFNKTFINYMSIGFDAKVGFNFEKKRSSCRCCNKCIYCWEAFKRYLLCKSDITLTNILDSIQTFEPLPIDLNHNSNDIDLFNNDNMNKKEDLIHPFIIEEKTKSKPFFKSIVAPKSYPRGSVILKGDPIDLVCQNINFYFGGTRNIWEKSAHLGLKIPNAKDEDMRLYKQEIFDNFEQQRFDDKKIELFTYSSGVSMALENVSPGQASKIYQGKGPAIISFKKNPNEDEFAALNKVYLNVDGEFFHLLQPVEIKIELNEEICGGQINFLKNEKGFV